MSDSIDAKGLDGAMEAAFRKRSGSSVLAAIEALGGSVSRVLLTEKGDAAAPAPVVKPVPGQRKGSGKYEVAGEIARGGVGVIYKGRDPDLGRDVALKVLREDHAANPELLRRFVEEAQIGGQLQHPGIVPVYELGLNADQQPFFSMKLVKGQTLSALLQERGDPSRERARYLAVFEQVCQTIAYAHSRGVIHRDLKPSNVMVGAFGEVQVVDWGFAKVLRHGGIDDERRVMEAPGTTVVETVRSASVGSDSCAGSVMGTPAYMPPEQATGSVDALDERSDVFSLGAVLCEILTGRPPYVARDEPLLVQAAKGRLDEAMARLDACGAERGLVALAKRCLSPGPAARPANAGELARAITGHLARVAERARESEREADAARIRAREEKKRRVLAVTLSSVLLVAVATCSAIFLWMREERHQRRALARMPIESAIEEAATLRGKARENLERWQEALEQAERALALTRGADIDPALVARTQGLIEGMRREREQAESEARTMRRDRALVARLEDVYTWRGDDFEEGEQEAAYVEAFSGYGLPAATLESDEAVARMKASAAREEIVAALDDRGLHDLASRVDPDPWRVKVRAFAGNEEELGKLAAADLAGRSPRDLLLLAESLAKAGGVTRARRILRGLATSPNPGFRVAWAHGWWLGRNPGIDLAAAAHALLEAARMRPDGLGARYAAGFAAARQKDHMVAVEQWRPVHARDPEFAQVRSRLAAALSDLVASFGSTSFNLAHRDLMKQAVELSPNDARLRYNLGVLYGLDPRRAHDAQAIEAYQAAARLFGEGDSVAGTAQSRWILLNNLWTNLKSLRQFEDATKVARMLLELSEDRRFAPASRMLATSRLCFSLAESGHPEDALAFLGSMNDGAGYLDFWRGSVMFDTGAREKGIARMRSALAGTTVTEEIRFGMRQRLALALRQAGDANGATAVHAAYVERMREAADARPGPPSEANYGGALLLAGRAEEGREILEGISRETIGNPLAYDMFLMRARFQTGDYEGCLVPAERFVSSSSTSILAETQAILAISYWKLGRQAAAQEAYVVVRRILETRDLSWYYHARELCEQARRLIEGG